MRNGIFEIERKFLIRIPEPAVLNRAECSEITQTYLASPDEKISDRVRKRVTGEKIQYTHTCKTHVSDIRRIEIENEITEADYLELLKRADPERNVISKKRYCLGYGGHTLEIDVYSFWNDRATLEIELQDEKEAFGIPDGIQVIKEVTDDRRYANASLARQIPDEDLSAMN